MKVVLSIKQLFTPTLEILTLMENFQQMMNDCIRIGLAQNKTSFMSLRYACYPELKKYKINSAYKNNAISRANGILSSYRRLLKKRAKAKKSQKPIKKPYCWKPMLTTCKGYVLRIEGNQITLPQKVKLSLNDYALKRIQDSEIRSITVNAQTLAIAYSKEVQPIESMGVLGIDMNLENMTCADSLGKITRLPMEQVVEMKQKYREVKRHFKRNDVRIREEIFGKYGKLQADKTQSEIHKHTARLIKYAMKNHLAIALEDLTGMGKLYRKGNGQGKDYRFKLMCWARGEARRQFEYKGKVNGVMVFTVNPRGTSAKCSACGSKMSPEENRMLRCPNCGLFIDRDVNAAINIRNRGLEKLFSKGFSPIGLPDASEAMKGNPMKERTSEVILLADGSQSSMPTVDAQTGVQ